MKAVYICHKSLGSSVGAEITTENTDESKRNHFKFALAASENSLPFQDPVVFLN